jgi:hypothetical protein
VYNSKEKKSEWQKFKKPRKKGYSFRTQYEIPPPSRPMKF